MAKAAPTMADMSSFSGWHSEVRHRSSSRGRRTSAYRNSPADLASSFGSPAAPTTHSSSFLSATPRGTEVSQLSAFTTSRTLSKDGSCSLVRTPTTRVSLAFSESIDEDTGLRSERSYLDEQSGSAHQHVQLGAPTRSDAQCAGIRRQTSGSLEGEARGSWLGGDERKSRRRPSRQLSGASWSTNWARPARSTSRDRFYEDVLEVQSLAASSCAVSTFAGTGNSICSTLTLSQEDGAPSPVGVADASPRGFASSNNGKGLCEQDLLDLLLQHDAQGMPLGSEKPHPRGDSRELGQPSRARTVSRPRAGSAAAVAVSSGSLSKMPASPPLQAAHNTSCPADIGISDSLDLELMRSNTPGHSAGSRNTPNTSTGVAFRSGTPKETARPGSSRHTPSGGFRGGTPKESVRAGSWAAQESVNVGSSKTTQHNSPGGVSSNPTPKDNAVEGIARCSSRGGDPRQSPMRRTSALLGTGRAICRTPT